MHLKLNGNGRPKMPPPPPRGSYRLPSRRTTLVEEIKALPAAKIHGLIAHRWPNAEPEDVKDHFLRFVETDSRRFVWATWLEAFLDYRTEAMRFDFGRPI